MKKYLFAAACCLALVGMTQGCNEAKDFDTTTFAKLCKYTHGTMKDGDETHCYCDNTKCDTNVVCGSNGKCIEGSAPDDVEPTPSANECNETNNGKTLCIVENGVAGMATCNGVSYVMAEASICESNKCNAAGTACEPVQSQPTNDPGCDAEHVGDRICTDAEEGGQVVISDCQLNSEDGSYHFVAVEISCASNQCNSDHTGCAEDSIIEESACDAEHLGEVLCVEESGSAFVGTCYVSDSDEYAVSLERQCESNRCNDDGNDCFVEQTGLDCQLGRTICDIIEGEVVISVCQFNALDETYSFVADDTIVCESNQCNEDNTGCLVLSPVDACTLGEKKCADAEEEGGSVVISECQENADGELEFVVINEACASNQCNANHDGCFVEEPVENACTLGEKKCADAEEEGGSVVISECQENADGELEFVVIEEECASNQCNEDHDGCFVEEPIVTDSHTCNDANDEGNTYCAEADGAVVISVCTLNEADATVSFVVNENAQCASCNEDHGCTQAIVYVQPDPEPEPEP